MNAIIFPGQGAQYVGMGKSLYDNFSSARSIFDRADEVAGFELSKKCFQGPEEDLKDTSVQQLAILVVSLAAYEVFKDKGNDVGYLSGLSLGEYSCLYAAGVLGVDDVVALVRERAKAMAYAASINPATMFAVMGIDRALLKKKANELSFYIANINSPTQTVISLKKESSSQIKEALESAGARVIELSVSGGFHSPFMQPAKDRLEKVLAGLNFKDASIPIVSNVTASSHTNKDEIKANLAEQLVSSVLWCDCANFIRDKGAENFFEVGPSKVLKGLMRKIDSKVKVVNVEKKEDFEQL
ncbi:MAG: ACP S-malonyltransferase [Candidatus Omnitrophica bacterium]|nr:ACP S-malonyltransferase [Candidatus Omnitrophota bacterium]